MTTAWLQGYVKEVPSGDTLVIAGRVKPGAGPPPEKRITLSSLIAPKLGKRDGTSPDEAFAWQSREFLRKKCIGQQVVFKVDYVLEQIGNREFGSVFLGKQDNVALSVVSNGWAKASFLQTSITDGLHAAGFPRS
jgi:staphylococcal nuclease domain-containing protein 1